MTHVLILLIVQALLEALDSRWRRGAGLSGEPALHATREVIQALVLLTVGWIDWTGQWAGVLIALIILEAVITMETAVAEDRARHLPPRERMLHTAMAIVLGLVLAGWAPVLYRWWLRPMGFFPADHGPLAWGVTVLGLTVLVRAARDVETAWQGARGELVTTQ